MNAEQYFNSLTDDQRVAFYQQMNRTDELGLDIVIYDAIDIWYLLPNDNRGPKPVEEAT